MDFVGYDIYSAVSYTRRPKDIFLLFMQSQSVLSEWGSGAQQTNKQTNSMVWVRERTTPTERPPLVGEVIANFCG
jgi:hypothetical protein